MTRFYYDAQGREHESGDWDAETARSEPLAEGLRGALQAIIDLRVVVPDHPHGGVHPPYLEWVKVAEIVRAALAARSEPLVKWNPQATSLSHEEPPVPSDALRAAWEAARSDITQAATGGPDFTREAGPRSEPRAEGLREGDWLCPTCGTLFRFQPDAATPPAEGLDVERLARAYAEAGYGPALTDEEWQDIAREYAALAPEQPE